MANTSSTKDDIARLIKGKSTKNKVGSRTIPHRLNKTELVKFQKATNLNYLKYNSKTRLSLLNSFDEFQYASNKLSLKINTDNQTIEITSLTPNKITDLHKQNTNLQLINPNFAIIKIEKLAYKAIIESLLKYL